MSRPRRSLQSKSYAESSSEDEIDTQIDGISSDSASGISQNDAESNEFSDVDDSDSNEIEPAGISLFPEVLSASQIHHTRALVVEQAALVAELQAKYEEYSTLAAQYHSRLQHTNKMLSESRSKVAPISRIPPELLGVIFNVHVGDNLESPWTLMKVCRAWRATSLLTRNLWRGIMLVPNEWRWANRGKRFFEGMQVCAHETHIKSALKRAGPISLDVRIVAVSPETRYHRKFVYSSSRQKADVEGLLKSLLNNMLHSRIRSLSINVSEHFTPSVDTFDYFPCADMESLIIDFDNPKLIETVKKESSHLKTLHIPSTSAKHFVDFGCWTQIVDLAITRFLGTEPDVTSLVAAATRLESLHLGGIVLRCPGDDGEPLAMPLLDNLAIISNNNFWPIICPNLTQLTIGCGTDVRVPSDQSITLPHLTKLICLSNETSVAILRAFKVLLLHTLIFAYSIGKSNSAQGVKRLWPLQSPIPKGDPSEIEPIVLYLVDFSINPKLLAQTLRERASVEKLITEKVMLDSDFFESLAPVRNQKVKARGRKGKGVAQGKRVPGSKPGWNVGCLQLRVVSLDLSFFPLKKEQIDAIRGSAKTFLSQRENVNAPLDSLSIRFSNRCDWEELVQAG